jgi:hypothetical protein
MLGAALFFYIGKFVLCWKNTGESRGIKENQGKSAEKT